MVKRVLQGFVLLFLGGALLEDAVAGRLPVRRRGAGARLFGRA